MAKGQWFIISAVIASATFLTIAIYFSGYSLSDSSRVARLSEDYFFSNAMNGMNSIFENSSSDQEFSDRFANFKQFIENEAIGMGYMLDIETEAPLSISGTEIKMTLASTNMNITRKFSLPLYTTTITSLPATSSTTTSSSTTTITTTTYPPIATTVYPVGYWSFSEGYGNYTADSSGKGNTAYLRGSALKFDGVDDYVEFYEGYTNSMIKEKSNWTFSAWVEQNSNQSKQYIYTEGDSQNLTFVLSALPNGHISCNIWNYYDRTAKWVDATSSNKILEKDQWAYITITLSNGTDSTGDLSFYANGNLIETRNSHMGNYRGSYAEIGGNGPKYPGSPFFNGTIDDVRIYSRALNSQEVMQNYNGNFSNETGLVFYIPFSDASGNITSEFSGNGNSGTLFRFSNTSSGAGDSGNSGWSTYVRQGWTSNGKYGSALNFNGIDDYIYVENSPSIDITNAITVEAWVKMDSYGVNKTMPIVSKSNVNYSGPNSYQLFYGWGNDLYFVVGNGSSWASRAVGVTAGSLNTWMHVAGTYDGKTLSLYHNGILMNIVTMSGNMGSVTTPLYIGATNATNGDFWKGTIDEVRIYNSSLSQSQISYDMDN